MNSNYENHPDTHTEAQNYTEEFREQIAPHAYGIELFASNILLEPEQTEDNFIAEFHNQLEILPVDAQLEYLKRIPKNKFASMAAAIIEQVKLIPKKGINKLSQLTIKEFIILSRYTSMQKLETIFGNSRRLLQEKLSSLDLSWVILKELNDDCREAFKKLNSICIDNGQGTYLNFSIDHFYSQKQPFDRESSALQEQPFQIESSKLNELIMSFATKKNYLDVLSEFHFSSNYFHANSTAFLNILTTIYPSLPVETTNKTALAKIRQIQKYCNLIVQHNNLSISTELTIRSTGATRALITESDKHLELLSVDEQLDYLQKIPENILAIRTKQIIKKIKLQQKIGIEQFSHITIKELIILSQSIQLQELEKILGLPKDTGNAKFMPLEISWNDLKTLNTKCRNACAKLHNYCMENQQSNYLNLSIYLLNLKSFDIKSNLNELIKAFANNTHPRDVAIKFKLPKRYFFDDADVFLKILKSEYSNLTRSTIIDENQVHINQIIELCKVIYTDALFRNQNINTPDNDFINIFAEQVEFINQYNTLDNTANEPRESYDPDLQLPNITADIVYDLPISIDTGFSLPIDVEEPLEQASSSDIGFFAQRATHDATTITNKRSATLMEAESDLPQSHKRYKDIKK